MKADGNLVVEFSLNPRRRSRKAAKMPTVENTGKLPRITRLLALAIKFEDLVRNSIARDYANLARLGCVTRARVTQIMNLLLLAPTVQEEILSMQPITVGRDPVSERSLRRITAIVRWDRQRKAWQEIRGGGNSKNRHGVDAVPS